MKLPTAYRLFLTTALCGSGLLLGACSSGLDEDLRATNPAHEWIDGLQQESLEIVDLTYPLNGKFPAWPGDDRTFEAQIEARAEEAGYFSRSFWTREHYATHLDAPAHFPPGAVPVDKLPLRHLIGPAVVVDIQKQAASDADYRLTPSAFEAWEQEHGRIPAGAIVLARTGWADRVSDADSYRNMDSSGVMHFPGFSTEAVELLLERKVVGLGIDTLSVDYGPSGDFPVHRLSHGAGLYHLENLADLSSLPEDGAVLIVAPMKLEGGSGAPVRVFALVPR